MFSLSLLSDAELGSASELWSISRFFNFIFFKAIQTGFLISDARVKYSRILLRLSLVILLLILYTLYNYETLRCAGHRGVIYVLYCTVHSSKWDNRVNIFKRNQLFKRESVSFTFLLMISCWDRSFELCVQTSQRNFGNQT